MKTVLETKIVKLEGKQIEAELVRTNLSTANRGLCGSSNNCYFKGTTTCYSIVIENYHRWNFKRKTDAVAFLNWLVATQVDTNFTDIDDGKFYNSEFYPVNFQGNC